MKPSMSLTIVAILLIFVGVFPGNSVEMDDLVFYFSLDEGQGDKIKDFSPNKLLGTVEKNPKWIDGKVERGLHFTLGKNQGVLVEHNDILNLGTEDVSLEAWFKTAKKTGQGFMLGGPETTSNSEMGCFTLDIMMGPLEEKSRAKRPLRMINGIM